MVFTPGVKLVTTRTNKRINMGIPRTKAPIPTPSVKPGIRKYRFATPAKVVTSGVPKVGVI
jgi:hypothetical protein